VNQGKAFPDCIAHVNFAVALAGSMAIEPRKAVIALQEPVGNGIENQLVWARCFEIEHDIKTHAVGADVVEEPNSQHADWPAEFNLDRHGFDNCGEGFAG